MRRTLKLLLLLNPIFNRYSKRMTLDMLSTCSVCMDFAKEKSFSAYQNTILALMLNTNHSILSRANKLAYLNQSEKILNVACSVLIGVKIIQSIFTGMNLMMSTLVSKLSYYPATMSIPSSAILMTLFILNAQETQKNKFHTLDAQIYSFISIS